VVGTNILEESVAPSSTSKIDTKYGGEIFFSFEDGNSRFSPNVGIVVTS
jgi:hypothetical protein